MLEKNQNSLILKIKNKNPIELNDLTISLNAFSSQYLRFLEIEGNNPLGQELKLYIREIQKGSIIAELFTATAAYGAIEFPENIITIIQYAKYLKTAYDYFLGKIKKQHEYTKQDLKNLKNILEPTAKDNGSILIIQNSNIDTLNINSTEANAAQNSIKREENKTNVKYFSFVTFQLFKTRKPQDLSTGFSGVILEILEDKICTVNFQDIKTRDEIVSIPENPLLKDFKVDVIAFYENDIPVKYQITKVYKLEG